MERFSFRDVVVVADLWEEHGAASSIELRRDLEMTDSATLSELIEAIRSLRLNVHHYQTPGALAENANKHSNDIVLSIYGGQDSRNRMALVPAVCESFGLRFIGPDTYGRVIAQDKGVSKRLAVDCGLLTPAWRIVRSEAELEYLEGLALPVVVKPMMEGSSIGISQRNIANSKAEIALVATELLEAFKQPVLVEEFVVGREVAYCRIESTEDRFWSFSEIVMDGDPSYFHHQLFDAKEKALPTPGRNICNIDPELTEEDRTALDVFLKAYGSFGYCRVDGRLADGRFHFLELTPDAWIGPSGQFARSFTEKGWSYQEVIAAVLASSD